MISLVSVYLAGATNANQRECEEALFRYEAKYGMGFDEFAAAWDAGEFDRYSHEIERDFMEWEGFRQERGRLLGSIKEMRRRVTC